MESSNERCRASTAGCGDGTTTAPIEPGRRAPRGQKPAGAVRSPTRVTALNAALWFVLGLFVAHFWALVGIKMVLDRCIEPLVK